MLVVLILKDLKFNFQLISSSRILLLFNQSYSHTGTMYLISNSLVWRSEWESSSLHFRNKTEQVNHTTIVRNWGLSWRDSRCKDLMSIPTSVRPRPRIYRWRLIKTCYKSQEIIKMSHFSICNSSHNHS